MNDVFVFAFQIVCSETCTMAVSGDFTIHFWRYTHGDEVLELNDPIVDPILDVGSSIHTSFIAYSTIKSVWIMGDFFDTFYTKPKITSYSSVDEAFAGQVDATMCRPVKPHRPSEPAALCSLEALFDDAVCHTTNVFPCKH